MRDAVQHQGHARVPETPDSPPLIGQRATAGLAALAAYLRIPRVSSPVWSGPPWSS